MPLININEDILSDLVAKEAFPAAGYARRVVNVTGGGAEMPMGTLVFRTIASGALDQSAAYAPVNNTGTQLVATNEFAVVFGDGYSAKKTFTSAAVGDTAAVAFVRGEVQLKDEFVLSANSITRDSAAHKAVKALLEKQGIIMLTTLGA